jgi:hypothetical protein
MPYLARSDACMTTRPYHSTYLVQDTKAHVQILTTIPSRNCEGWQDKEEQIRIFIGMKIHLTRCVNVRISVTAWDLRHDIEQMVH